MADSFVLNLPMAPSVNRLWRMGKGKMYKSTEYGAWISVCSLIARVNKPVPILGKYKLLIEVQRPDKRRRDIDNFIKATSDLLEHAKLIENDCFCEEVTARWAGSGSNMIVTVEKIT